MGELFFVALAFLMELLEFGWQYSPTLGESLAKNYRLYQKSIFLFLLMHFGYIYIIFFSLKFDILNFPILFALTLKSIDIFTKIELINRVYIQKKVDPALEELLKERISPIFYLLPLLTYPYLIYWAMEW